MPDTSGHDATQRDTLHTMTLSELEARVSAAGVLISRRQLMRHCEAGTFDAQRLPAVNNVEQWFIAPGSVEKGIADIKTLQEQRARRDATRPVMTGHDGVEEAAIIGQDTSGYYATRPDASDTATKEKASASEPDTSGHVATGLDIFEHPYVLKLESQVEKWENKYHDQVRRTEEIQTNHQKELVELQRMTAVAGSKTLADFMLQAKDLILGPRGQPEKGETQESMTP